MEWLDIFKLIVILLSFYAVSIWSSAIEGFESGDSIMLEEP